VTGNNQDSISRDSTRQRNKNEAVCELRFNSERTGRADVLRQRPARLGERSPGWRSDPDLTRLTSKQFGPSYTNTHRHTHTLTHTNTSPKTTRKFVLQASNKSKTCLHRTLLRRSKSLKNFKKLPKNLKPKNPIFWGHSRETQGIRTESATEKSGWRKKTNTFGDKVLKSREGRLVCEGFTIYQT
jgi:hypothetical protein